MLEQLLIFTRGGLILWTCKELGNALRGSPIDTLIRSCLLEERSGAPLYNYDAPGASYTLKRKWGSNDFRRVLMSYCQKESSSCSAVACAVSDCATNSSAVLKPLLSSEFCLQPKRESYTSRYVFDCMLAGSVPVFFQKTAYEQYEWFMPGEPESYSVFIDQEEVRNGTKSVKQVLMSFSKEEIKKKREKVIETIPRIIYSKPNGGFKSFKDAFDIALDGALERIKEEKEWADFL